MTDLLLTAFLVYSVCAVLIAYHRESLAQVVLALFALLILLFVANFELLPISGDRMDCCHLKALNPKYRLPISLAVGWCVLALSWMLVYSISILARWRVASWVQAFVALGINLGIVFVAVLSYQIYSFQTDAGSHAGTAGESQSFVLLFMGPLALLLLGNALVAFRREESSHINPWHPLWRSTLSLIATAPALLLLSAIAYPFTRRLDAIVLAFTQTYYHTFSQLDAECVGIDCGGHYLCSVAALGPRWLVKPLRLGRRGGTLIVVNRQLLIANAFEERIAELAPSAHRLIRRGYDGVGRCVHRYYGLFRIPMVSVTVYLSMKPLEWTFLAFLYCSDTQPERRIARQYALRSDCRPASRTEG